MTVAAMACIQSCDTQTKLDSDCKSVSEVVVSNIMARRSIRKYTDKQIPRDTLDRIIECGYYRIKVKNGKVIKGDLCMF